MVARSSMHKIITMIAVHLLILFFIIALNVQLALSSSSSDISNYNPPYPQKEAIALNGMVAAVDARAAEMGVEVLKSGGNAVDALLTTAFLMALYEPWNSGLGGHGGHMAFYDADKDQYIGIDGTTKCPLASTPDMFANEIIPPLPEQPGDVWRVEVEDDANSFGFRGCFAPSTVAAYAYLAENFGTMKWEELIQPAIEEAEKGFVADEIYANAVNSEAEKLKEWGDPAMYDPFVEAFLPDGKPIEVGDTVRNTQMANTLKLLAEKGPEVFYEGEIADKIVNWVQKNGGILTKEDFTSYEIETSKMLRISYKDYGVLTYANGSNGSAISQIMQILSNFALRKMGYLSPESVHVITEAMKIAFTDRYHYVGDRDFLPVPYDGLVSWGYGRERANEIDMRKAQKYEPGNPWAYEQNVSQISENVGGRAVPSGEEETTFFCAVDKDRNMILVTSSNQSGWGCDVVVPGLGFPLNSSMNNMMPAPPSMTGGHPLTIEPGKHVLRNSGPCIVTKDNEPMLLTSAPGGRRIITSIVTTLINRLDYKMSLQKAIDAPRIHCEANGMKVRIEDGVPQETLKELDTRYKHSLEIIPQWELGGRMLAIEVDTQSGLLTGAAEPRTHAGVSGY